MPNFEKLIEIEIEMKINKITKKKTIALKLDTQIEMHNSCAFFETIQLNQSILADLLSVIEQTIPHTRA